MKTIKSRYETGMFIGRFQPMHKGHVSAIQKMLEICKNAIIVIGSSQYSLKKTNPLSLKQRKQILESVIDEKFPDSRKRIKIFSMKDVAGNKKWILDLRKRYSFDAVFTSNPLTQDLAVYLSLKTKKEFDIIDVKKIVSPAVRKISGTKIRELISKRKDSWKKLVTKKTLEYIENNKLVEVIRKSEE